MLKVLLNKIKLVNEIKTIHKNSKLNICLPKNYQMNIYRKTKGQKTDRNQAMVINKAKGIKRNVQKTQRTKQPNQ